MGASKVYWHGRASGQHFGCGQGRRGKLVMECVIETKARTILEFIQGLHGSLCVTLRKAPVRPGCTTW